MDEKSVTIITGSGKGLGSGHFQRMLNLASFIIDSGEFTAFFLLRDSETLFPPRPDIVNVREIPEKTSLIIRDMRDSHPNEIGKLKERAPVMVVDDAGEGRYHADYRIDLLPGLYNDNDPREDLFLYGYNFTDSIKSITDEFIEKSNDLLIYGGASENRSHFEEIVRYLPESINCEFADPEIKSSYAKTLLSSKVILTHFGIMLYEGLLSRCSLAVINPSEYHKLLTEKVSESFPLLNLGQISDIEYSTAANSIFEIIDKYDINRIEVKKLREVIKRNLKNFHDMLGNIIY